MDIRGWAQGSIGSNRRKFKKKKNVLISKKLFSLEAAKPRNVFAVILGYLFHLWLSAWSWAHEKKAYL